MNSRENPAVALAQRLRGLREYAWPDVSVTQRDLATALGGNRALSVSLISSWENLRQPVVPPADRLLGYATFFASRRSVEERPFRLVADAELTLEERQRRQKLEDELLAARDEALSFQEADVAAPVSPLTGPWRFEDGKPITIVCAPVPPEQEEALAEPDDPRRAYAELYSYADADSLIELYGHIRAVNPLSEVVIKKAKHLKNQDYTTHMVLLGGTDWNDATKTLISMLSVPVSQVPTDRPQSRLPTMYRVESATGEPRGLHPEWDPETGQLISDIGHFVRTPNPLNAKRTLVICNGLDSRGVLGTVRALTDERFRDRNAGHLAKRFGGSDRYSILARIRIFNGTVLTPDWTSDDVLHEWPDSS